MLKMVHVTTLNDAFTCIISETHGRQNHLCKSNQQFSVVKYFQEKFSHRNEFILILVGIQYKPTRLALVAAQRRI